MLGGGLLNIYKHVLSKYEGHSRISDNESIYRKILSESELFVTQNVDIGVACLCLKYGVFITTRFDAIRIFIQHYECLWPRKSPLWPFLFGGRIW